MTFYHLNFQRFKGCTINTKCKAFPIADKFAKFALCPFWNEARSQKTMTKQVRDPLGIFDIGFSSRNVVHMLRIDNDRVEILGFENIIQRFPVGAGV